MLYLTCTTITSVDLAHYGVSRAKDWVSVDCCTRPMIQTLFILSEFVLCYSLVCACSSLFHNLSRSLRHTDGFTAIPFYLVMSSTALAELAMFISACVPASSSVYLFSFPFTVSCRPFFPTLEGLRT